MKFYRTHLMISLFITFFFIVGCEKPVESNYTPPATHSISKDGIMHKSGLDDPVTNCASCHGDDLRGGDTGVSCYECHSKKW